MEKRANHAVSAVGRSGKRFPNAACFPYQAVPVVSSQEGEGGMFLPSVGAVGMPGILPHPSYLLGEPEHGAWTSSRHISAGFHMPS